MSKIRLGNIIIETNEVQSAQAQRTSSYQAPKKIYTVDIYFRDGRTVSVNGLSEDKMNDYLNRLMDG